jgi:pimeloyl-ACP methyl ester carboxylesterase
MSAVSERFVQVAGGRCRLLEKGEGEVVGVIAGHFGLPRWTPFLEALSQRRRVILISPPGFPGSDAQHEHLDGHLDWIAATLDLLERAGVAGKDIVAASVGAMLAADAAAFCPGAVRKLSLTSPYGIFLQADPVADIYAQTPQVQRGMLCADGGRYDEAFGDPDDPSEAAAHQVVMYRAATAGARISWPLGDKGLRKRLHRIRCALQLVWGDSDQVVPAAYAETFSDGVQGTTTTDIIPDAGHLAWIDQPQACAAAIERFLADTQAPAASDVRATERLP